MPRKTKDARLWLRPIRRNAAGVITHESAWYILDRGRHIGTGCAAVEKDRADEEYRKYLAGNHPAVKPTLAAERAAMLQRSKMGNVYFLSCDKPLFPIKIGFAIDVRVRMKGLQGAMPWPLHLLFSMEGDVEKERELHSKFSHLRMEGEWFARGHELLEYIEQVRAVSTRRRRVGSTNG